MSEVVAKPGGTAFEVFVKNAILKVQKEASGRGKEVAEIRKECEKYLETLEKDGFGDPFDAVAAKAAIKPLQLACGSGNPRIIEPALGCIHKLVSWAWIRAESTPIGHLEDGSLVGEIVGMVVKCLDTHHSGVYLAVVTALLTFATAEHFVAHGQCLLYMVRSVFHLAITCETTDLRRTACNALLQMLNTIVKRVTVTQFQMTLRNSGSIGSGRTSEVPESPSADGNGESPLPAIDEDSATPSKIVHGSGNVTEITPADDDDEDDVQAEEMQDGKMQVISGGLTAKLASLAEKQDIEGLEAALEQSGRDMVVNGSPPKDAAEEIKAEKEGNSKEAANENSSPRVGIEAKEGRRPPGWANLTVLEKDVLLVITAFCKHACTSDAEGGPEDLYKQGKLLALELLVKVFENAGHKWGNVQLRFCEQLRVPLCRVLVRNCSPVEPKAFQFSVRLFCAIILQEQLRLGLKAELGALYPLLLMRPLESRPLDPGLMFVALSSIKRLSREPQMQVDLFINYDCDLQAANLYERTAKVLGDLAVLGDPTAPFGQGSKVRDAATACCTSMLSSVDAWAGPIRDAAAVQEVASPSASYVSEVSHFSASKEKKNSLNMGLELFNRNPLKGVALLVASNVVENKPDSLATFLRKYRNDLDETMLGEYMGHHDDMPTSVMHAYIDMEEYEGLSIDEALRKLLAGFRLPGEAQKIDRIMEKFAGRYCQDNPTTFKSADDAYVLAFAIIMLNTDAHNPMADQRMTREDFVMMNCRAAEPGVQVLPAEELEAIFDRITTSQIQTRTLNAGDANEAASAHKRLASAVGLSQLILPFRSGIKWNKERGVQLELRRLNDLRRAMKNGALGGDVWFTASHTEHARPMLEAGGQSFLKALAAAIESAPDAESAHRAVESLKMAIQLAALLGCDSLCQQMVIALANATGVRSREALIRANPHSQVIALQGMISVASDDHAGLLGSSWTTILRTISSVESLVSELRRSPKQTPRVERRSSAQGDTERSSSNALGRLLSQFGLSTRGSIDGTFDGRSNGRPRAPPGGSFRAWIDREGGTEMDKVFVGSSSLDGDAVLVFTRALCAVSLEELNPEDGSNPRVFSLRKLVECAYYNLDRIRLVWGRLWSAISAHLVNASCHPDQTVSMYAVDSLRQLVGKLLARAELASFTTQGDTLRPFVMVLKHCSSVMVRELTIQCIDQAMATHSARLGSGWVLVLEVLDIAAIDPAASVVRQCLDTLQLVIDSHWKNWGKAHDVLMECIKVGHKCARNPHHLENSLRAVQMLKFCATELLNEGSSTEDILVVVRSSSLQLGNDFDTVNLVTNESRSVSMSGSGSFSETKVSSGKAEGPPKPHQVWSTIFEALASITTQDERRRCADMAADVLFHLVEDADTCQWEMETWNAFVEHSVKGVFNVLQDLYVSPGGVDRVLTYSKKYLPQLWETLVSHYNKVGSFLLPRFLDLLVVWMQHPLQAVAIAGVALLQALTDSASNALDIPGWGVVIGTLREAWKVCTCSSDVRAPINEKSYAFKAWLEGPKGAMTIGAIRSRCQVLIAFQQYIDKLHASFAHLIPHNLQLELVDILLESVSQAGEANRDSGFLAALNSHITPGRSPPNLDTVDLEDGLSPNSIDGNRVWDESLSPQNVLNIPEAPEASEVHEMNGEDEKEASSTPLKPQDDPQQMEPNNQPEAADDTPHEDNHPAAVQEDLPLDGEVHEDDQDAQEAAASPFEEQQQANDEPTISLPNVDDASPGEAALRSSTSGPSSSASAAQAEGTRSDVPKGETSGDQGSQVAHWPQLIMDVRGGQGLSFQGLVRIEAEGGALAIGALLRCLQPQNVVGEAKTKSAQKRLLAFCQQLIKQAAEDVQATWGNQLVPDPFLAPVPLQVQWDQAARAPVVAQALDAYRSLNEDVLAAELKELFPYLSKLVYCQQAAVRQALAKLLYDHLSPLLFNREAVP